AFGDRGENLEIGKKSHHVEQERRAFRFLDHALAREADDPLAVVEVERKRAIETALLHHPQEIAKVDRIVERTWPGLRVEAHRRIQPVEKDHVETQPLE